MVRVGIAGGSGYGGLELIRLLLRHPEVELRWVSSAQHVGTPVTSLYPHLQGFIDLQFSSLDVSASESLDVLFLALPHGEASRIAPGIPDRVLVIDLSGDFRIQDPEVFERYYGLPMAARSLQREFVYGLPEINRELLKSAQRIANPGCFATASILALLPLVQEHWIDGTVFVDSKTGSSGAGRTPSAGTHHPRRSQSLFPYKPFSHQHYPEIVQALGHPANELVFQTYSAPIVRGIFASHYMTLTTPRSLESIEGLYWEYYGGEPFVRWIPGCPDVSSVRHSNLVDIGAAVDGRHLIVWSTLDNLQKGAAGQAVQNMNIRFGWDEAMALDTPPLFP